MLCKACFVGSKSVARYEYLGIVLPPRTGYSDRFTCYVHPGTDELNKSIDEARMALEANILFVLLSRC